MNRLLVASVLGVGGLLAGAGTADAQLRVIGTGGTPSASLGYYSPAPGTLYSPFVHAPPVVPTGSFFNSRFAGPTFISPNFATGGFTVTRTPGTVSVPHHRGWAGRRR
jgi:hypothetical protein